MQMADDRPTALGRALVLAGGVVFVVSLVGFLDFYLRRWGPVPVVPGAGAGSALFDLALFTIFALHHSIAARLGFRDWVQTHVSPRHERSLYVWISSLLFIAVYTLWQPVPTVSWETTGAAAAVLTAIQLGGMLLTVAGARRLDVLDLAGVNQGFDRPTSRPVGLVSDGLYAIVRHPIYLGWVIFVWAAPIMTGTRLVFAAVSTAYLVAAVPLEERSLRQVFGAEYDAYARRVRWRIVPFVY
jgi:protein-S-isoprenylcysteine O-methyltransferase Ste14